MIFTRQQSPLIGWNPSDDGRRTNQLQSQKYRLQTDTAGHQRSGRWSVSIEDAPEKNSSFYTHIVRNLTRIQRLKTAC